MRDNKNKNITIQVEKKKVVPIKDIDVKILEKNNNSYCVRELIQTKQTKEASSYGIVEKDKHIALKLKAGNIKLKDGSSDLILEAKEKVDLNRITNDILYYDNDKTINLK